MAKFTKDAFIEGLKEMSLLEIKELVDAMKEEFGIDPTAVAAAGPAAGGADAGAPTEVSVIITSDGGNKVAVIKAVREITGLGLMDAKKAVEALPYTVKEEMDPAAAEELAAKLKESGAEVEVK
jgi:large subunit ribosomal protein L7/L12